MDQTNRIQPHMRVCEDAIYYHSIEGSGLPSLSTLEVTILGIVSIVAVLGIIAILRRR